MKIRKQYQFSERVQSIIDPSSGRTHQSFKDECDINIIVSHWLKTGVMPSFLKQPFYGDVSEIPSYQDAQNLIIQAEDAFDALTPEQQQEFGNPINYLEAVYAASSEVGTENPLDVTVPTDTFTESRTGQKGGKNASSKENAEKIRQEVVQSDSDPEASEK